MSELRTAFLDYFDRKGHHITASTPLIPEGDPSLLFNSAGMVPFKPYFLGSKKGLDRAASCQKCFRTTDIDEVGKTIRHLTFFEMLGNFSFGDYFKKDAIHFAWDFLTRVAGLDPKRLYPTVFKDDAEAEKLWRAENTPNPATLLGKDTNFWAMGETGPCGPCSEIYYDLGPEMGSGPANVIGGDGDRYLEIWNLVFMQFDRQRSGQLKPLPAKNIDTGMGLERLAMLVEGKSSPFQTSLFEPIRQAAAKALKVPAPDFRAVMPKAEAEAATAYRIISDHTRAAVMLIAAGIIPSNVERGYVLRRLIRRASRYGRLLGAKEPFLHKLVGPTLSIFKKTYPELEPASSQMADTLYAEEGRFLETLGKGEHELEALLTKKPKKISGAQAFKLYDTFGFPLELTREICADRGVTLEESGFIEAQEKAVEKARAAWKGSGQQSKRQYDKFIEDGLQSEFVGYEQREVETRVIGILNTDGPAESLSPGDEGELILAKTPFYAESGGQVGDRGELLDDAFDRKVALVADVQKPHPDLIVHRVIAHKTIRINTKVRARVDKDRRRTIAYHHTATHLLGEALRRVLGAGVRQAGSLVAPDRLRFDFTHSKALTKEQLKELEGIVNEAIREDLPVIPQERPAKEAAQLGAVSLLGEKYGEHPRFLLIGAKGWDDPQNRFSLELCGGIHVADTGEIASFKIVKESSVAAGIRRIEAVAGPALEQLAEREEAELRGRLSDQIKEYIFITSEIQSVSSKPYRNVLRHIPDPDSASVADVRKGTAQLDALLKDLKNELTTLKREKLFQQAKMGQVLLEIAGMKLSIQKFDQAEVQTLRQISDRVKREIGSGVVFLASTDNHKLSFVVSVTQNLVEKGIDASQIAKTVAEAQKGRSGGRKDFAQGGGPDADWEMLVTKVKDLLSG